MHSPLRLRTQRCQTVSPVIRWRKQWVNVSSALVGQNVGLEVVDDGLLDVYFGVMKLGRLHERHMRIEDHMGRFRRCT